MSKSEYRIRINNHSFDVNKEETILEAALRSKILIRHSCKKGRCRDCIAKVEKGKFFMPEYNEGLNQRELDLKYCLTCITKPLDNIELSDVQFTIGELPEIRTIPSKISVLNRISKDVIELTLRIPPTQVLKFLPGQYVDLNRSGISRSYSIASSTEEKNLKFLIKRYKNGKFSEYLFSQAKLDDLIQINGPKGSSFFNEDDNLNQIILISTGTGIAPNLSILDYVLRKKLIDPSEIYVIHGQRDKEEHVYNISTQFSGINTILCTSRNQVDGFYFGYVQQALENIKSQLKNPSIYICGNPSMVNDTLAFISDSNLSYKTLKTDIFIQSH